MSVRDGILAVLCLGPAYGLQVHSELSARAPHRRAINVGQIYATLDRLGKQALIETAGMTDDSLPRYRLTDAGAHNAAGWMTVPLIECLPEWTEMLDQVLITSSINPTAAKTVAERYRRWWESDLGATRLAALTDDGPTDAHLARVAREAQGVAAIAWLGSAISALANFDTARPLSEVRPKRGRRPGP